MWAVFQRDAALRERPLFGFGNCLMTEAGQAYHESKVSGLSTFPFHSGQESTFQHLTSYGALQYTVLVHGHAIVLR